jgi:hypothetical protein
MNAVSRASELSQVRGANLGPVKRINAKYHEEAPLYFANGAQDIDPKRGLGLYGPTDKAPGPPQTIRVGIVSDGTGIQDVTTWAEWVSENPVKSVTDQFSNAHPFPGFLRAFNCRLVVDSRFNEQVTSSEVSSLLEIENPNLRIKRTATLYAQKVEHVCRRVTAPDVIICHTPEEIERKCASGMSFRARREGALTGEERQKARRIAENVRTHDILSELDDETKSLLEMAVSQDFRTDLKANCLEFDTTTQILAQSTLVAMNEGITLQTQTQRHHQDAATIAWNLAVAIYYKSNRFPWRVGNLMPGTCYVGVSFFLDKTTDDRQMFASLAQVFMDTGQGLVVRGDSFRWPEAVHKAPRMSERDARDLLEKAVRVYRKHHNDQPPNRLVLHKSSHYSSEELKGFRAAILGIPRYDFLTLSRGRDAFFYRNGDNPVLRGTAIGFSSESYLLYTNGYIPYLRRYDGPRVPRPIEISEKHGDTPLDELAGEILALTRLNWNTTDYSCYEPITLEFSRHVGDILGKVPSGGKIQEQYRYYM